MKRLSDEVRFYVIYSDATPFGSHVSGRFDRELRTRLGSIMEIIVERGLQRAIPIASTLLGSAMAAPPAADLFEAPGRLREEVRYPLARAVTPARLIVQRADGTAEALELDAAIVSELAQWFGEWQRGAPPPATPPARKLYAELERVGALTGLPPKPPKPQRVEVTLIGHATVLVRTATTAVLVDPFLFGVTPELELQPLTVPELGRVDAVFITHSHPDHFDLGSLLRLGADVPIFVPPVERESLLSIDMAARLRELGFRQVREIAWWRAAKVGDIEVTATPFYGEQPTVDCATHDELTNVGNTYYAKLGDRSVALTVDSGSDYRGSLKALALEARARLGSPDVVLGGHRGFAFYPIQYLLSSVPNYLLFVPRDRWAMRQRIMCNAEELLDGAEAWGARGVVPYAGGGAPWFWRIGLGPTLDGSRPIVRSVDPEPEQVAECAAQRSWSSRDGHVASSVCVRILRPGDGLQLDASLTPVENGTWPYRVAPSAPNLDEVPSFSSRFDIDAVRSRPNTEVTRSGDTVAWLKKKALLGLLARHYAAQHGLFPSAAEVQRTSDNFRHRFALRDEADTRAFFEDVQITDEIWTEIMTDITAIEGVEQRHLEAVLARVPAVERVWSLRGRKGAPPV